MAPHAEIAGAGLVGLALAAGLGRAGWTVRLHEAGPTLRVTGGGLYILRRGLDALAMLGLDDAVLSKAWRPTHFQSRLDGAISTHVQNVDDFRTMLRQDLFELLLGAARATGAEIVTGSRIVLLDPEGAVTGADGTRYLADLAVSAEGVTSRTADMFGLVRSRRRFDEGLIRVLADRTALTGLAWDGSVDLWSYSRRPLRALYTPCSRDLCYLALMAPIGDRQALKLPIDTRLWSGSFPELAPLIATVADPGRVDRYGTIRLNGWTRGRTAIVGDAAHAMPSSLGQGANVGIANVVALVHHLQDAIDIEAALRRWEEAQRSETEAVQDEAERLVENRALVKGRPETEPVYVPGKTRKSA